MYLAGKGERQIEAQGDEPSIQRVNDQGREHLLHHVAILLKHQPEELRRSFPVEIRTFRSYLDVQRSKVEELLIPADRLERRILPLSTVRAIKCFSSADRDLVQSHLAWSGHKIEVELDEISRYVEGQSQPPGSVFLDLTKQLYEAIRDGKADNVKQHLDMLASTCFD